MNKPSSSLQVLTVENESLRARLAEAEEALSAIRNGEVDALLVAGIDGEKVYLLEGVDYTYRAVIEEMSEGVLTLSSDGIILYANRRFAQMLKAPLETVIGSAIQTWVSAGSRMIVESLLQQKGDMTGRDEAELIARDGSQVPVQLSAVQELTTVWPATCCLVVTDLSEYKMRTSALVAAEKLAQERLVGANKVEQQLIASESNYRILTNRITDQYFGMDTSLRYTYWNSASETQTGISAKDALGRSLQEVFPDTAGSTVEQFFLDTLKTQKPAMMINKYPILGRDMFFEITCYPSPDGLSVFSKDITEQVQAKNELHRYSERLEVISTLDHVITSSLDINTVYDAFVAEMKKLVAFDRTSIDLLDDTCANWQIIKQWTLGKSAFMPLKWFPVKGTSVDWVIQNRQAYLECEIGAHSQWPEHVGLRKEGIQSRILLPLLLQGKIVGLLTLASRQADAYTSTDVILLQTLADQLAIAVQNSRLYEQARLTANDLEQRVNERTSQLLAANKELESFTYSVSHDLRSPLRGIDGWSQALLEDKAHLLDAEGRQYLERVQAETQRMGKLIDGLLGLSRISRSEIQVSLVDLSRLAQTIVTRVRGRETHASVEFMIQSGISVTADPRLLDIALTNLIENAVKFSATQPHPCVEFGVTSVNGRCVFFVRDNGVGFDMSYAKNLFGAFQRLHKQSEFPGTGIGLATVQRIIHRHGGIIWAEAQVNAGATFYFTIEETP